MSDLQHLAAPATAYALPAAWRVITMVAYFAGFAAVMGTTVVHSVVLRPALDAHQPPDRDQQTLRRRSSAAMTVAGTVFLLSLYPQLAGKVARAGQGMPFGRSLEPSNVWDYLSAPAKGGIGIPLGTMVLVQFVMFGTFSLLLVGLALPGLRSHVNLVAPVAAIGTAAASVMLSLAGDLTGQGLDSWMDKLPSYIHVLSGCTWVGGIAALAALGAIRRRLDNRAAFTWAHMWKRFSRIAQICVGGIIVSGLWMTWQVVGSVSELWSTPYGRLLLIKITLVAALILIGAYNEYVLLPRIARLRAAGDGRSLFAVTVVHFPRVALAEAMLGAGVLLVIPFLNGSARKEAGAPQPHVTGSMFLATAVLLAIVLVSFAVNARVQGGLEQPRSQRQKERVSA